MAPLTPRFGVCASVALPNTSVIAVWVS